MSLWTPYAEEALDLSKPAVKIEPPEQSPAYAAPGSSYYMPVTTSPVPLYPNYTYGYPVPSPDGYPVQISPGSSAGYEEFVHQRPMLSPPDSPESVSRQNIVSLSSRVDTEFLADDPEYQAFERDALRAMAERNGGTLLGNNPRMRRSVCSTREADDSYRQQREKNNVAAKRSRDRRKLREARLALKVTYLEKKTAKVKAMLASRMCTRCNYRA